MTSKVSFFCLIFLLSSRFSIYLIEAASVSPDIKTAKVVDLSSCSCIFGFNRIWPISHVEQRETFESDDPDASLEVVGDGNYYHVLDTPEPSRSFKTLGMTHGAEDKMWESPESPFLRRGIAKSSSDEEFSSRSGVVSVSSLEKCRKEENKVARLIAAYHPIFESLDSRLRQLELKHPNTHGNEPKSAKDQVLRDMTSLEKIFSFLPDEFKSLRLVNSHWRSAQDRTILTRLNSQFHSNIKIPGIHANLFLTHIVPKMDNLMNVLKEGLLNSINPVLRAKYLILADIAHSLELTGLEFLFDGGSVHRLLFREICMLGLLGMFSFVRANDYKFYLNSIIHPISFIEAAEGDDSVGNSAQSGLILLIEFDRLNLLEIALQDLQLKRDEKLLRTALMAAVEFNRPGALELIIKKIPISFIDSVQFEIDRNSLMLAIELGHIECLKVLFSATKTSKGKDPSNIDFHQMTSRGMTIAHFAVHRGDEEIIRFLWEKGVFHANPTDSYDRTAIHFAAAFAPPNILRLLLRLSQEQSTATDSIHEGYPLMTCDVKGFLPLHYAVITGNVENAEILFNEVEHSIYFPNLMEQKIISETENEAARPQNGIKKEKLFRHNTQPPSPDAYKRIRFFRELFKQHNRPELVLPHSDGAVETPLHSAVKTNRLEMVKLLINYLPQLMDWRDEFGRTPFLIAITYGLTSIVGYFLQILDNPNGSRWILQLKDSSGNNGMHLAIKYNHEPIFDMLLLSHLFSVCEVDGKGFTSLQLAEVYGRPSILAKIKNSLPEFRNRKEQESRGPSFTLF